MDRVSARTLRLECVYMCVCVGLFFLWYCLGCLSYRRQTRPDSLISIIKERCKLVVRPIVAIESTWYQVPRYGLEGLGSSF